MAAKPPGPDTEGVIVDRVRAVRAEQAAHTPTLAAELDRLFGAHQHRVHGLCLRMTGDPERARELTQETLAVAWQRIDEFEGRARFSTWIHAIARNLCLNAIRKKGELLTHDGVLDPDDDTVGVLARLQQAEREALLQQAAAAVLDDQEQEAVWLRYGEGLGQDDITRILDLPGTGARGLLQRCRRKLGRELRRRLVELGEGSSLMRGG